MTTYWSDGSDVLAGEHEADIGLIADAISPRVAEIIADALNEVQRLEKWQKRAQEAHPGCAALDDCQGPCSCGQRTKKEPNLTEAAVNPEYWTSERERVNSSAHKEAWAKVEAAEAMNPKYWKTEEAATRERMKAKPYTLDELRADMQKYGQPDETRIFPTVEALENLVKERDAQVEKLRAELQDVLRCNTEQIKSIGSLSISLKAAHAEVERLHEAVAAQLHYDMRAILTDTPEHRERARAEKAEKERDEAMADVGILKRGMLGDYDLDAWLDWVKKADALKARAQKAELEVKDMNGLIFELSKKAPHLNGCAKLVNGGWLCDERCLVDKLEKTEAHLRESDRVMDEVLEENSKLEALVKELREALIAAENVLKRCDHDNDRKCDQCDAWDKARAALAEAGGSK